jgi:glycosyltransferase involved in cell wall biosynthesis
MKVLQVIDSGGLYGAERVLLTLMKGLGEYGTETELASIGLPGEPEKPLEVEARRLGLETRRVTMKTGADLSAARRLAQGAAAEGFHLIHTHGYKANILLGGLRRKTRRLPVVATLHGWTSTDGLSKMGLYERLERLALRHAERVVAVSEVMVERWELDQRYGAHLRVIPNGIESPEAETTSAEVPEDIRRFVGSRRSVIAAGRLSQEKGFDVLVDALALMREAGLDVCLVIAGEGEERQALAGRAQDRGVLEAVMMPGFFPGVRSLLAEFDALAIPSRTEGLPVVLLEALMRGVSVVATRVGGIPAVLERCGAGACVAPDDPRALADELTKVLESPRDPAASRGVAERAGRAYSAQAMNEAYIRLYAEALPPL